MKARYAVQCNRHGIEAKTYAGRMVLVGRPLTKKQRRGGCPLCKAEALKATEE
jgi:hypothetical protein